MIGTFIDLILIIILGIYIVLDFLAYKKVRELEDNFKEFVEDVSAYIIKQEMGKFENELKKIKGVNKVKAIEVDSIDDLPDALEEIKEAINKKGDK